MKKNLILTDEPIEQDYRILKTIEGCDAPIVINCTNIHQEFNSSLEMFFFNTVLIVKSFLFAFPYWKKLYSNYKLRPASFMLGLKTSVKAKCKSQKIFQNIKEKYSQNTFEIVYANDLMCGLVGVQLSEYFNVKLIYDAHEVEFNRNRKNSFLRTTFDILCEKYVIKQADKIVVVNKPIKQLYKQIYNINDNKISVVNNNHFRPHFNYALGVCRTPSSNNKHLNDKI